ncbi:TIGR04282 family arsenosugar biosynthesis glycosyltransferase [Thiohalobacter thiocyanaticus]|uniref:Glycosyltransferase n=1 Tax=Thiohalobacter thiocyanaticus TaxID=585455 RepID=A0A426QGA0_9GAMM|nr:TIGR04282 family arsenosugar biosynthesis glycosyltransferase [Thiohalobacter thiocyanaticus]RRQ20777.1 glycosyltransferase [Thiohalobacter thiocyanaticus]
MSRTAKYPGARLLLFARSPVRGQVKRRLAAGVGEQAAYDIHCAMTAYMARMVGEAALMPARLYAWPDAGSPWLRDLAQHHALRLEAQQGVDLGERMFNALVEQLRDSDFAILIGSDCPSIEPAYMEAAAARLQAGVPWVFGPAEDGGYVLVGTRLATPEPFQAIDWGTAAVMEQTRERCRAAGLAWEELDTLYDVDTREDWVRFQNDYPGISGQLMQYVSSRHSGAGRNPETTEVNGFRPAPE